MGFATTTSSDTGTAPSSTVVADFNHDGKPDFAIAMTGDDSIWIYFGDGAGGYSLPVILPLLGASPTALVTAELNQDGNADLVVVEAASNTVGVLLGKGDGTFQPEHQVAVDSPLSLAVGDFNGDGKTDVIVGQMPAGQIFGQRYAPFSFLAGDGTGNLAAPVRQNSPLLLAEGDALAAADLNNDGKLDLVVVCSECTYETGTVQVYLGNGDGTFRNSVSFYIFTPSNGAGELITAVNVGDLNHDGCQDMVLSGSGAMTHVYLGSCDGMFTGNPAGGTLYALGDTVGSTVLADVDGDGNLDLIAGGVNGGDFQGDWGDGIANTGLISVLKGDGKGGFLTARLYRAEPGNWGVVVADLNGDGRGDIIAPSTDASTLTLLINNGNGEFGKAEGLATSYSPLLALNPFYSAANVADVNGDGLPDVTMVLQMNTSGGNYNIAMLRNRGGGQFADAVLSDTGIGQAPDLISSFTLADFRHTGKPDFVAVDLDEAKMWFATNHGDGTFSTASVILTQNSGVVVTPGDFNGDGNLDVAIAGPDPTNQFLQVGIMWGHGDGTFTAGPATAIPNTVSSDEAYGLYVGDYNRDGRADILYQIVNSGPRPATVWRLLGNGDGTFQAPVQLFYNVPYFRMADMNNDGCPDIVIPWADPSVSKSLPGVSVYLCQGDGTFGLASVSQPYQQFATSSFLWSAIATTMGSQRFMGSPELVLGDFNGDGKTDVAYFEIPAMVPAINAVGEPVTMGFLLGNGDGTLTQQQPIAFDRRAVPGYAADFNGDGRADLLELTKLSSATMAYMSQAAAGFRMEFRQIPVLGNAGHLRFSLPMPTTSPVTIALQATDARIGVPTSITIPGGSAVADVDFTVAQGWNWLQTFAITATLGSEQHKVVGYALPYNAPAIEVSPSYLDFGSVDVGIPSSPQTITITNFGTAASAVSILQGGADNTSVGGNCGSTLAAGVSCQATVTLTPSAAGSAVSPVDVNHDGFTVELPAYIYGVGITTSISVTPSSMTFRAADQTTSAAQTATITNTGSQPLVVVIQLSGTGFSQQSSTCGQAVSPGQSCTVAIQYRGSASSPTSTGQLLITGDFQNNMAGVSLTGTLLSGHASVSPTSLSFATQPVLTTSASQRLNVTNTGSLPLLLWSFTGAADFGTTTNCDSFANGLPAGQSCTIDVEFAPAKAGTFQETLQIQGTGGNTPLGIPLSGTAAASGFMLPTGAGSSQTIKSGQQAAYPLSYAFSGNGGTIQFTCSGVPSATCSVAPQSTTQASGTLPLTVSVSTQTYSLSMGRSRRGMWALGSFVALGMLLMLPTRKRARSILALLLVAVAVSIVSCGGGGGNSGGGGGGGGTPHGTPPGTYTINVQAQGPGFADSYQLQLTVQ